MPYLQGWLDRFLISSLFETAMLRLAPWSAGDPETRFP
jgi:hypothetical protein